MRVTAFLAGGFLPPSLRGAATHKLVHIADWYPTSCILAAPTRRRARSSPARRGRSTCVDVAVAHRRRSRSSRGRLP